MDEIRDRDLLIGDDAFAADLREALRRREAKRPHVDVPADFLDSIMQQVEAEEPHAHAKTWRIVLTSLAIAACTITAVLLVWPKGDEQEPVADNLTVCEEQALSPSPAKWHPVAMKKTMAPKPVAIERVPQQESAPVQSKAELEHYMAELESGLADVRDSCYLAQVERLISDNEELQRLMNEMTNQKQ